MTHESAAFKEEMELKFGTEEALGVTFALHGENGPTGQVLTPAELLQMWDELGDNMPGSESLLPHGGSAICCTDYAVHIFLSLPGRVQIFGFANEDNPTSRCAREEFHPGGHDFALVDGRYIVDPWPRLVPELPVAMIYDYQDADDAALALDIYGPRECWGHMTVAEETALEDQALRKAA